MVERDSKGRFESGISTDESHGIGLWQYAKEHPIKLVLGASVAVAVSALGSLGIYKATTGEKNPVVNGYVRGNITELYVYNWSRVEDGESTEKEIKVGVDVDGDGKTDGPLASLRVKESGVLGNKNADSEGSNPTDVYKLEKGDFVLAPIQGDYEDLEKRERTSLIQGRDRQSINMENNYTATENDKDDEKGEGKSTQEPKADSSNNVTSSNYVEPDNSNNVNDLNEVEWEN